MGAPAVRSGPGVARGSARGRVDARRSPSRSRSRAVGVEEGFSEGGVPRARVAAIQRSRLLAAALCEMDERGYACTTVAHITARSRVSRRTFYELFANREECLGMVLEQAVAAIERDLAEANLEGLAWRERVRGGLWAMLCFFDREPAIARVCVVGALGAGSEVLARREAILTRLAAVVDEGRGEGAQGAECNALTAEGVVGAALAIVHARLLRRDHEPLRNLLGELVGMIVLPYQGKTMARREQQRPLPVLPDPGTAPRAPEAAGEAAGDPLVGVPMRLTYRTARVLEGVGEHPGASNRQLAEHAGIGDQGQVSKLLARLQRLGLLENAAGRATGEPNAWTLTPKGQQVTQSISTHTHRQAA